MEIISSDTQADTLQPQLWSLTYVIVTMWYMYLIVESGIFESKT